MIGGMITGTFAVAVYDPGGVEAMGWTDMGTEKKSRIPRLTVWIVSCDDGH
ncbi:hypothetical protein ACNKHT_03240 [Shigella flexneri]